MSFSTIQKVRFDDVDGAGIVYYPQFYHLCHNTFEDFFDMHTNISYPELITKRRKGFPTVSILSQFTAPLRYGDTAIVMLSIQKIGNTSVEFHYQILRQQDQVECFKATITTVFIDLDTQKPVEISDDLKLLFKKHL